MKKIIVLFLCFALVISFSACGDTDKSNNNNDSSSSQTTSNDSSSSQTTSNDMQETTKNENSESNNKNEPSKQKVYVVKSFLAVEGAVIYDQTYDTYGYPDCCYFHKKCESCGYVSNNNGSARSNLTSSHHCIECGNDQRVEIKADGDWIEVYN